jgi:hypothetical protein
MKRGGAQLHSLCVHEAHPSPLHGHSFIGISASGVCAIHQGLMMACPCVCVSLLSLTGHNAIWPVRGAWATACIGGDQPRSFLAHTRHYADLLLFRGRPPPCFPACWRSPITAWHLDGGMQCHALHVARMLPVADGNQSMYVCISCLAGWYLLPILLH